MIEVLAETNIPDAWFWYTLSMVLADALIWVIQRYINRHERILERVTQTLEEMKTMVAVHDAEIKNARKDIEMLKSKVFK